MGQGNCNLGDRLAKPWRVFSLKCSGEIPTLLEVETPRFMFMRTVARLRQWAQQRGIRQELGPLIALASKGAVLQQDLTTHVVASELHDTRMRPQPTAPGVLNCESNTVGDAPTTYLGGNLCQLVSFNHLLQIQARKVRKAKRKACIT